MFCGNCGSQNPDGVTKCAVCGAPLTEEKPADNSVKAKLLSLDKNKLTGYAIIAAVVLVVLILLIVIFSGRGDTSTLKQYAKASFDLDAKDLVDLRPKAMIKAYAEEEDISTGDAKDEIIDEYQDMLDKFEDNYSNIDFEEIGSIKVEIRKEDNATSKEIREMNEGFEDEDIDMKVKDAKSVKIKVSGKHDGDKFSFTLENIYMVKVGGSWYILSPDPTVFCSALNKELAD